MRTVKQVWLLSSGDFSMYFDKRETAMLQLANQEFLDNVPDDTVFILQPGYQVVDAEVPGLEYYDANPN